jgi:DNA-binding winged helix-turn-helix (wHTH) protein/Tol biopolymer transport system component
MTPSPHHFFFRGGRSKVRGLELHAPPAAVRFGRFELRFDTDLLTLDGRSVHVQPQPLRLLRILVQHAGEIVSREALRQALWGASTFVEFDQSLNYCIRQLRIALHDDAARPIYIETIKRQGYRFTAPVETVTRPPLDTVVKPIAVVEPRPPAPADSSIRDRSRWSRRVIWPVGIAAIAGIALLAAASSTRVAPPRSSTAPASVSYHQVTNFSDAAFAPALSPDGGMLAFMVGSDTSFPPSGEVYVKLLPNGEPLQLTHDGWPKYGPAFSPDGTTLAYTVNDSSLGWSTRVVSPLGGESRLLLANASGLVWLDPKRLMFAEIVSGLHMRLVTSALDRSSLHPVYLPEHERAMAHFGRPSPDGRTALVVEMGSTGSWQSCRMVPLDGHDAGVPVGPDGACTAAAWSPDGTDMYFTAWVDGESHVWRQSTHGGRLEQLTHGPTDEQGLAVSPDGRTLVTSVGMLDSGVWMRDASGDRLLVQEGTAARLTFSHDGRTLYYLLRQRDGRTVELRAMDMTSQVSRTVVSGLPVLSYDLSADDSRVVMAARTANGAAQLWIGTTDGQTPPRMLPVAGDQPCFGPGDTVYFRRSEHGQNYLFKTTTDGATPVKARDMPVLGVKGSSPDKQWVVVLVPIEGAPMTAVIARSNTSAREVRICPAECMAAWSPDGSRFYVEPFLQGDEAGTVIELPVKGGDPLPALPPTGIASASDARLIAGARRLDIGQIDRTGVGGNIAPGPAAGSFAYARVVARRNLFELQLQ